MAKQDQDQTVEIDVEVYMEDGNPPVLYDFFIDRAGAWRKTPITPTVGGLIQVVMAGPSPPTTRQMLTVRRQFGFDTRLKLLNFY